MRNNEVASAGEGVTFSFLNCALMVRICAMSTNMTDNLNALAKNLNFFGLSFKPNFWTE